MAVLFYSSILFLTAFLIHFFYWKIRLPKRQTQALLLIFFTTLIIGSFLLWKQSRNMTIFGISAPKEFWEYVQLYILFISVLIAYIATYVVVEVDSPSLVIIASIFESGSRGLDKNILEKKLNNDLLILPRLRGLVTAGLAHDRDGIYSLRLKGKLMALIFITYRRFLKRIEKGG